jgi:hypothetical protein
MEEPSLIQNYGRIALCNSSTATFRKVQYCVLDLEKFKHLKDLLDFKNLFCNCSRQLIYLYYILFVTMNIS